MRTIWVEEYHQQLQCAYRPLYQCKHYTIEVFFYKNKERANQVVFLLTHANDWVTITMTGDYDIKKYYRA